MSNKSEYNDFNIELWSEFMENALREESFWIKIMFPVLLIIIFLIGLIGNLLICIVIYYDRTMHTATNYYLFNLAVSDLIITFAILLEVDEYISESYQYSYIVCKVHFFLLFALWNNSIMIMTALSIERYIAICHPMLLKSSPVWRRVTKVIVLIWVIAILQTLPELWAVQLVKAHKSWICFTVPTSWTRVWNGVLALISFLLPLGIMTFVYVMIAFKVNATTKTTTRDKIFNHRDNRSKVNRLITLTLSFTICWLPFCVLRVLIFTCNLRQLLRLREWWTIGLKISSVNCWMSTILNPFLFSLMSTKFRKSLKALWKLKFKKTHDFSKSQVTTMV